jgi:hypothetical protein
VAYAAPPNHGGDVREQRVTSTECRALKPDRLDGISINESTTCREQQACSQHSSAFEREAAEASDRAPTIFECLAHLICHLSLCFT